MPVLLPLAALAEIIAFVAVGQAIGVLPAILLLLATSVIGVALLGRQGARAFAALREAVGARRNPQREVADGALLTVAAVLVVLPGFLTDLVGFALLVPAVRRFLSGRVARRVVRHVAPPGAGMVVDAAGFAVRTVRSQRADRAERVDQVQRADQAQGAGPRGAAAPMVISLPPADVTSRPAEPGADGR
ncbi:FxsA family protein [Solihabitans fulvus]|uniref:FxsA family protein n=1 Tax=Solihabitans fulvus TaxID=1892852 RepID=UPI001661C1B5|nr:FxsA family protein [Solihabitans fulvus]